MGLSIGVGVLAFLREHDEEGCPELRRDFEDVNRLLRSQGLPAHKEPEVLPQLTSRRTSVGQPYRWLHYLRRAVARALLDHTRLTPVGPEDDPVTDPLYDEVLFSFSSHVVCHSDCDGYYVPIDFPEPIYDDLPQEDEHCIAGGILGSSQGAMRELIRTAPLLGIRLEEGGALSDAEARVLDKERNEDTPFWIERQVWLNFYEKARLSIEHGTAIVFG